MNGIGSYPTLVRRWLDRTNDSPARSSIRRSIRNGVMIPAQPSSTATASGPSAAIRLDQACDHTSPRNGSCSPPTIAG